MKPPDPDRPPFGHPANKGASHLSEESAHHTPAGGASDVLDPDASGEDAAADLTDAGNPRLSNRMPQTDTATVALARGGDSEAFRALVDRHSRAVYRLAHRMTGSPSDAEDVVQETFLKAYKQLGRFESRANFSTWLHRIAVNCSIDLIRSRPHRETGHDATDLEEMGGADVVNDSGQRTPERLMLSTEVQDRINTAMATLSSRERAAFVLRHFEGNSIEDISRSLGLKTNATKHSIFRAVRKMRAALEPFMATEDHG
jgi:RNA polymerase sigma-70 factor (ECF subfamily)